MPFDLKKNPTKIAICGTGSGWELLPIQSDHTIYCLNDYVKFERYQVKPDVLFIMDVLDEKPQVVAGIDNLGDIISRINKMGVPLVAPFKYEEIPLSEAFPLDECVKQFGTPYFLNTIAFMIAYAILKGAKEIDIFGVNQASSSEYFYEKASVEYWLGVCNGLGIKITIHGERSELLTNKARLGGGILYGYHATYQHIKDNELKFGTQIIKRLLAPSRPLSKTIRKIN